MHPLLGGKRPSDGQGHDGRQGDLPRGGRLRRGYARIARGLRHSDRLRKRLRQAHGSRRIPHPDARRQGHQGGRVQRKDGRAREYEARLDVEGLIQRALDGIEVTPIYPNEKFLDDKAQEDKDLL